MQLKQYSRTINSVVPKLALTHMENLRVTVAIIAMSTGTNVAANDITITHRGP